MSQKTEIGLLTQKQREAAINKIIGFFETERDEKIGVIAAEEILDMFLDEVGAHIYNKGIRESKRAFEEHMQSILIDLEMLTRDK